MNYTLLGGIRQLDSPPIIEYSEKYFETILRPASMHGAIQARVGHGTSTYGHSPRRIWDPVCFPIYKPGNTNRGAPNVGDDQRILGVVCFFCLFFALHTYGSTGNGDAAAAKSVLNSAGKHHTITRVAN